MRWLRRLRGAIGIGATWAFGWAAFGLFIGVCSKLFPGPLWDRFFDVFDAPLPAMGVPGFIGGVMFSMVLGAAARRRRFDELTLKRVAVWGALGGLLVGLLPAAMVAVGLATLSASGAGLLSLTAMISGPLIHGVGLGNCDVRNRETCARTRRDRTCQRLHRLTEVEGVTDVVAGRRHTRRPRRVMDIDGDRRPA